MFPYWGRSLIIGIPYEAYPSTTANISSHTDVEYGPTLVWNMSPSVLEPDF